MELIKKINEEVNKLGASQEIRVCDADTGITIVISGKTEDNECLFCQEINCDTVDDMILSEEELIDFIDDMISPVMYISTHDEVKMDRNHIIDTDTLMQNNAYSVIEKVKSKNWAELYHYVVIAPRELEVNANDENVILMQKQWSKTLKETLQKELNISVNLDGNSHEANFNAIINA